MVFTSTKVEANELALNSVLKQECQVSKITCNCRNLYFDGFKIFLTHIAAVMMCNVELQYLVCVHM